MVDLNRYRTLLLRAVNAVVEPIEQHFGIMPQATTYDLFSTLKTGSLVGEGIQQTGNLNLASVFDLHHNTVEVR